MAVGGILVAVALLGQGCDSSGGLKLRTDGGETENASEAKTPQGQVDVAVETIMNDAEASAKVEEEISVEVEVFEKNGSELDAYSNNEYEIK